jgi:hypothetical protein
MKLEWRKIPARFRFADCEFGQYRIAGRAGIRRKLHIELCDGRTLDDDRIIHDVPTARQICQDDYDARVAALAAANGYVKADDCEALKAKLAEVTDQLGDATDALDLIESEADLFDATAIASGYIKLADDEIVVKRGTLNALIDDHCADCTFDSLEIHDCANCDLKPIRDRIKATEATGAKAGPTVEDVIAIAAALNDSGVGR